MVKSKSAFPLAVLAISLVLVTLGCSTVTAVAPTPLPPTPTAIAPLPTAAPQPTGSTIESDGSVSVRPLLTPTPISVSLRPATPEGWAASLIVSGEPGATESGPIGTDGRMYVSWGVTNVGPDDAGEPFSVDLLLDGVPVERWASQGLPAGDLQTIQDWTALPVRAHLSPGPHTLQLVVDSTGFLQPLDAAGNSIEITFDWPEMPNGNGNGGSTVAPQRLPNLKPYLPEGWLDSIDLRGVPTTPAGLDDASSPGMRIAYHNAGLSSITQPFLVFVYLDGVLVTKYNQQGLIADQAVESPSWNGLLDTIRLTPGTHTLTLELDPTGLVNEADESDNTATVRFNWGGPAISEPDPSRGPVGGLPLLTEYVPSGWTNSLVITSYPGETASPSTAYMNSQAYVSWAMRNEGAAALDGPYAVELLVSGEVVHAWERDGLASGALDIALDEPIPAAFAPGIHSVKLRVRTADGQETDIASRPTRWRNGFAPPRVAPPLDAEERRSRIAALESIRSSTESLIGSDETREDVVALADLVYRAIYGNSIREEALVISILTDEEFTAWVDAECMDVAPSLAASVRDIYLEQCADAKGFVGYYSNWRGASRIVVRGDKPPMHVLNTIAHELGHFRQAITNPSLNDQPNIDVIALREAQAYAHQTVFFRTLESLTGLDLLLYPRVTGYETFVHMSVADIRSRAATSEHARGQLVLWISLLSDPELRQQRTVLLNNHFIPAQTAQEVFDYLVGFSPGQARVYVQRMMQNVSAQADAIESLVIERLVTGLPYWNEGSPEVREVGLLLP